ncbi:MAG: sigma 54-interacting transcriptional regulator [Myxococcota bacterium]
MSAGATLPQRGTARREPSPPRLRALHGPASDVVIETRMQVIGRGEAADVVVEDAAMSRRHFSVMSDGDRIVLADLGSSNGTFVDGDRVSAPLELAPGTVIAAGGSLWGLDPVLADEALPVVDGASAVAVDEVIGTSPLAGRLRASLATVGPLEDNVLLLGPTGAGKEVSARAVHRLSGRSGRFVPVNCAALPPELADSALFGHIKGSFTGADASSDGFFRSAEGGTLFLDELGELPESVQAKLLRTVETKEVWPVGATSGHRLDVRLVGATHRDLTGEGFRSDLFARLSDWVLELPSLRHRLGDPPVLLQHFLTELGRPCPVDREAIEALCVYDWPLNVREVVKLAQRLKVLVPAGEPITLQHLPEAMGRRLGDREGPPPEPATPTRAQLEAALGAARGNLTQLARDRGWHRTQLYRWLERHDLDPKDFRGRTPKG